MAATTRKPGLPLRVMDSSNPWTRFIDTAIQVRGWIWCSSQVMPTANRNPAAHISTRVGAAHHAPLAAGIPTLLLVGATTTFPHPWAAPYAIEEFSTLEVPHVRVLDKPVFLRSG